MRFTTNLGTLTVTKAPLIVLGDDSARPYGQTNPVFTAVLTGVVNNDDITPVFFCPATTTSAPGRYDIDIWLDDPDDRLGYYDVFMIGGQLTVTNALLTGTVASQTRAYGLPNAPFTLTYTGFVNPADSNLLQGTLTLACTNAAGSTVTTNTPVGAYSIRVVSGQTLTNYTVQYVNGTLSITQAVLTVTANNTNWIYGTTNPSFSVTYTGFVNGDTEAVFGGSLNLATGADTNSPTGTYAIVPSGLTSTNYALTFTNGTLTVTQAVLVVTADNQNRLYGATNPPLTGTLVGVVNADGIAATFATTATTASAVGGYAIEPVWSDPSSRLGNYTVTTNQGTLTISPAELTVTADAQSRLYGSTNPPLTLSYAGFVNGEDVPVLTTVPSASTLAVEASAVGEYPITVAGGSAGNYTLQRVDGTLSVTPAPLLITAGAAARSWGATNPAFTGTIVGTRNADVIAVSYTSAADTSAPVGTYPIVPSLDEPSGVATNYSVTLSNGVLTVTFDGATIIALSQDPWLYTVGLDPLLLEMYDLADKLVDEGAEVFDVGGGSFGGGSLTVDLSTNSNPADALVVVPEGFAPGQIGVEGETVLYGNVAFAAMIGGTNGSAPATRLLGINRSPWTADRYVTVREAVNTSLSVAWIIADATDADNDPITLTENSIVSACGGRIVKSGTNLVHRPAAGYAIGKQQSPDAMAAQDRFIAPAQPSPVNPATGGRSEARDARTPRSAASGHFGSRDRSKGRPSRIG